MLFRGGCMMRDIVIIGNGGLSREIQHEELCEVIGITWQTFKSAVRGIAYD